MAESRQPTEEEVRAWLAENRHWFTGDFVAPLREHNEDCVGCRLEVLADSWLAQRKDIGLRSMDQMSLAAQVEVLEDELVAQRDVVAAQEKALREIADVGDCGEYSHCLNAIEIAEDALAVVSGTPDAKE